MAIDWSPTLVTTVHTVKAFLGWFSGHSVAGLPLDWLVRVVTLGPLYLALRLRFRGTWAAGLCVAILLGTEFLELICNRCFPHIHAPDWGDLADVISGLAGIGAAEGLRRLYRRGKPQAQSSRE